MEVKLAKPQHLPTSLNGRLLQGGRNHRFIRTCELYIFTIRKFDFIQMTFLSSSIVLVVMLLLPMSKVCPPSFERKMTVKKLLNVVKFLIQTIWVECYQF